MLPDTSSSHPTAVLACRLWAPLYPRAGDVHLRRLSSNALLGRPFTLDVVPRAGLSFGSVEEAELFVRSVALHLRIDTSLPSGGAIAPAVIAGVIHPPTKSNARFGCGVRVSIRPDSFSATQAFSVNSVALAGDHLLYASFPTPVTVGARHEPAPPGALWAAAAAGDFQRLVEEMSRGCSTEEADEV